MSRRLYNREKAGVDCILASGEPMVHTTIRSANNQDPVTQRAHICPVLIGAGPKSEKHKHSKSWGKE